MSHAKHYLSQPMFHGAIQKIKVAHFYGPRCMCYVLYIAQLNHENLYENYK